MSLLLSVRGLEVGFGRGKAVGSVVRGVSFDLVEGETLAIVGESGSGKSVTALAINRLVDFAGGRILAGAMTLRRRDGSVLDLVRAREPELERIRGAEIAMIFQEPMTSLNPVLSIGEQLAEVFRLHRGLDRRAAMRASVEALERVRIADAERRLKQAPNQLSGGMLQRVMIAIAIAANPRLLIADEPTTALDVTVQAQIMALLAELKRETGMAMIFITHDIGLVAGIADRLMVMREGEVVEAGTLDRVLDAPEHPYTQHLLHAVPHFASGRAVRSDAPGPSTPVLTVEGLTVRFPVKSPTLRRSLGSVHAVEGVSFDLAAGETLAIVGESGSGKSTTARALTSLVRPVRGTWHITAPSEQGGGRPIQMVFQNPYASLNPRLDVAALLAEPILAAKGRVDAKALARMSLLIDRVGLPSDSLKRYPHQFSGGQRQRLCIARALMLNPSVLVLDEAVSALDVSVQARVIELLIDLQRDFGLAYLFISHDMAVVERIAHRVAVIFAGRIVEIGTTSSVLADPQHSYTRQLIAAVPNIESRRQHFTVDDRPVPSLVRPIGFEPSPAIWRQFGADHRALAEVAI